MVDLQAAGGIVSTMALLLIVYIVLSITLDWINHPFGYKIYKKRK